MHANCRQKESENRILSMNDKEFARYLTLFAVPVVVLVFMCAVPLPGVSLRDCKNVGGMFFWIGIWGSVLCLAFKMRRVMVLAFIIFVAGFVLRFIIGPVPSAELKNCRNIIASSLFASSNAPPVLAAPTASDIAQFPPPYLGLSDEKDPIPRHGDIPDDLRTRRLGDAQTFVLISDEITKTGNRSGWRVGLYKYAICRYYVRFVNMHSHKVSPRYFLAEHDATFWPADNYRQVLGESLHLGPKGGDQ